MSAKLARFTFWLHFRIFRSTMKGQQREAVRADALAKCAELFDSAWPEDYPDSSLWETE